MAKATQEQIDRAGEWVGENYPALEGAAFDAKVAEVLPDFADIDAARDREDAAIARPSREEVIRKASSDPNAFAALFGLKVTGRAKHGFRSARR